MAKRCFVISPIGKEGSEVREHADDVFDFIIKPAMDELGIEVYRSDHSQQIGRITEQMFGALLEEDLCIAVLTFSNPNVYYELAIAQCAARPVIIMIEKGHAIPFDVHDLRAVEYDLKPRPLRDKVYVQQIIEIVRNLEARNWTVAVPFGKELSPLGRKRGELHLYERVEKYGDSDAWMNLLRRATKSFDVSGVSLRWWTRIAAFRPTVMQKAEEGCKIRLLMMSPDDSGYLKMIDAGGRIGGLELLCEEIRSTHSVFAGLAASQPNIEVRQVVHGGLTHQLVKSDDEMLVSLVLYSQGTAHSPMLECSRQSPLFATLEGEFNALWDANPPSARREVRRWTGPPEGVTPPETRSPPHGGLPG